MEQNKLYEISQRSPSSMTIQEIISEWKLLAGMLDKNKWVSSYESRLASRRQELSNWLALGVVNGDFVERKY